MPTPSPTQVILFDNPGYRGFSRVIENGGDFSSSDAMNFPNDQLSSIKLGTDVRATLYEHKNFKGRAVEVSGSIPDLTKLDFNNKVSSIKIYLDPAYQPGPRQVVLFEHSYYKGIFKILEVGDYYSSSVMGFPNDKLSSVKVGSDVYLCLYEHAYFGGKEFHAHDNWDRLLDLSIPTYNFVHDNVSSVKVKLKKPGEIGPNQVRLFSHPNYEGTRSTLEVGHYNSSQAMSFPNDDLVSIQIGSQVKATLYQHRDFKGKALQLSESTPNLAGTSVGSNSVTSIKVEFK